MNELRMMGEYEHWKLQAGINQILQSTEQRDASKRRWAQDFRAKVFDARNPTQPANEDDNESSNKTIRKDEDTSLEQIIVQAAENISQAAEKASKMTLNDFYSSFPMHSAPKGRTIPKQTKHIARSSLR